MFLLRNRIRISLFAFLLLPVFACAGGISWRKSLDVALGEAKSTNRLIMVFYYVDYCDWCEKMKATTFASSKVASKTRGLIPVMVKASRNDGMERKYGLQGFPSVLLLQPDGSKWGDMFGYIPPSLFADELGKFTSAWEDWPEIQEEYRENPSDGEVNARMAWVYGIRRMEDSALSHLNRAKRTSYQGPYLARAHNMIGDIYQLSERTEKAIPYFKRALELTSDPEIKSYSLVSLASCCRAIGKYEDMRTYAKQLISLKGATPEYVEFARDLLRTTPQNELASTAPSHANNVKTRLCVTLRSSSSRAATPLPLAKPRIQSTTNSICGPQSPSPASLPLQGSSTPAQVTSAQPASGTAKP